MSNSDEKSNGEKETILMNLEQFIKDGEKLEDQAHDSWWGTGKKILGGLDLEIWATKVSMFMEEVAENKFLTEKVKENAKDLTTNGYEKYQAILGVLKAMKENRLS